MWEIKCCKRYFFLKKRGCFTCKATSRNDRIVCRFHLFLLTQSPLFTSNIAFLGQYITVSTTKILFLPICTLYVLTQSPSQVRKPRGISHNNSVYCFENIRSIVLLNLGGGMAPNPTKKGKSTVLNHQKINNGTGINSLTIGWGMGKRRGCKIFSVFKKGQVKINFKSCVNFKKGFHF